MRAFPLMLLAALVGCATPTTNPRPTGDTVDVLLIRGMLGRKYSEGLDQLADKIEDRFPSLMVRVVPYTTNNLHNLKPRIIIGHSLGANKAIETANDVVAQREVVDLLILYDAVSFNPKHIHYITTAVKNVYHYKSTDFRVVRAWGRGMNINNVDTNYTHTEIDNVRKFHTQILNNIGKL